VWLHVVGVVFLLVRVSRGEMSLGVRIRVSSRPQHPRAQVLVPQDQDYGGPSIMERFKRMPPPSFKGESDPCAEDDKVTLATYMLHERADVWWSSMLCTQFEDGAVEVGWDEFVRLFRTKFVLEHIQDKMEQEFLSLTQGSMTVLEYEAMFAELSKYAPHIVADERRKVKKFVMGLRPSLRTRLAAFDHRTLEQALSAACRQEGEMEQYLEEKKASQKRPAAPFQRQDRKKATFQSPQHPVASGSSQWGRRPWAVMALAGGPSASSAFGSAAVGRPVAGILSESLPVPAMGFLAPAVAPSPVGGLSFARVVAASLVLPDVPTFVHEPAFTDKGVPAVFFSREEMDASLVPFKFSVVAKTTYGCPPIPEIRSHLTARCSIKDPFLISALDNWHLLLRFKSQDDYLRKNLLSSIAANVGPVLQIPHAMELLINTKAARVCVELDLLKPRPERVWIGMGDFGGFWQEVSYLSLPEYCCVCRRLGHGGQKCRSVKDPVIVGRPPPATKVAPIPSKVWVPVVADIHKGVHGDPMHDIAFNAQEGSTSTAVHGDRVGEDHASPSRGDMRAIVSPSRRKEEVIVPQIEVSGQDQDFHGCNSRVVVLQGNILEQGSPSLALHGNSLESSYHRGGDDNGLTAWVVDKSGEECVAGTSHDDQDCSDGLVLRQDRGDDYGLDMVSLAAMDNSLMPFNSAVLVDRPRSDPVVTRARARSEDRGKDLVEARVKLPFPVKLRPPSVDLCLNVDGASKGNPGDCGGGGCIRDTHGNFICGFAFFYYSGSSILAETRALHDGLRLTIDRQLQISVVFSDSATLLSAIAAGRGGQRGAAPAPAVAAPATRRLGRPRAPARVFALAREDAEQADHVTKGDLLAST
ncbi:hypothetical protein Taro_028647, partial [Colocasia esculenta]|nr:hypothetical protein [Colocasia esculenta]